MLLRFWILVSLSSLFLISCADVTEEDTSPEASPVATQSKGAKEPLAISGGASLEESLQAEFVGEPEPNQYQILLKWAPFEGTVRVVSGGKVLDIVPGPNGGFTQSNAPGGKRVTYEVSFLRDGGSKFITRSLNVQVPQDVVVKGSLELYENQVIEGDRVFIMKNSTITTFDKNLEIRAKELISYGGVINNYPMDAKASFGKNGRSGGTVNITADKASGQLSVVLRGEAGGTGKSGVKSNALIESSPACPGTSGGNGGNAGSLSVSFKDGRGLNVSVENIPGAPGKAGVRGDAFPSSPLNESVRPPCDFQGQNGIDGKSGTSGLVCLKMATENPVYCR